MAAARSSRHGQPTTPQVAPFRQTIGVPAYFPPGEAWDRLAAVALPAGLAIANPASGPGAAQNSSYTDQIRRLQSHGLGVLGYVATGYAAREQAEVIREVEAYYHWYRVDGIFFDEASVDKADLGYYASLTAAMRRHGGRAFCALNPGRVPDRRYLTIADAVVTFEDTYRAYVDAYDAPAWMQHHSPGCFWHLIHGVRTRAQLRRVVRLSRERRAGRLYVTPRTLPNPWGELPPEPYWADELAAIR